MPNQSIDQYHNIGLRLLLENFSQGFLICGTDYNIYKTNFFNRNKLRVMNENFTGKSILKIAKRLLFTDEFVMFCESLERACTGEPAEMSRLTIVTHSGFTEYYRVKFIPGQLYEQREYLYILWKNITEEVLLEEEFQQMTNEFVTTRSDLNTALSNLDLYIMDRERAHNDLSILHQIMTNIQASHKPVDQLLQDALVSIKHGLGLPAGAVYIISEANIANPIAQLGTLNLSVQPNPFVVQAINHQRPIYIAKTNCLVDKIDNLYSSTSNVAIPLLIHGQIIGCLYLEGSDIRPILQGDVELLQSVANHLAFAIDHARHDATIERMAVTDGLTGLYNHRHFQDKLKQEWKRAERYNHPLSLLLVDIDNFKRYNDTYGHSQGDLILTQLSQVLQTGCREQDCVARYGGEEFAIILPETAVEEAVHIADRLRHMVAASIFHLDHGPLAGVTVSIGIACSTQHATTESALVNVTDHALYTAKRTKNCYCLYQPDLLHM